MKIGYNWLHIWGVMQVFLVYCSGGGGGENSSKHIFASPGEDEFKKNPCSFLYRFEHAKLVFRLMVNTVPCRTFRAIHFKMLT